MSENPWRGIVKGASGNLNALRVSVENKFNFFWAKNAEDRYALLLILTEAPADLPIFPKLKGVTIAWSCEALQLQLILTTDLNWELFLTLCRDVIARTNSCSSEPDAVNALFARLTRWQRFLARSSSVGLAESEVQGLFGELTFLHSELMKRFTSSIAVSAWHGPDGTPQDFAIGATLFEVKTHLTESSRTVLISSPEQLWPGENRNLYLTVVPLVRTLTGGTSLVDLVRAISADLADTPAILEFEDRLAGLGYIDLEEYNTPKYIAQEILFYRVQPNFPSILSTAIPAGVEAVRFAIHLDYCAPFASNPNWKQLGEVSV